MLSIDGLSPYEKGVVARWLLGELIGQAKIVEERGDAFDISIGLPSWQIRILAQFCKGFEASEADAKDRYAEPRKTLS